MAGSSPHTRGAPHAVSGWRLLGGIIPAYAGSTRARRPRRRDRADHPRIRGEHRQAPRHQPRCGGSSPHTRGAPESAWSSQQSCRIIPAYAGSTAGLTRGVHRRSDHPRIRGEHGGPDTRLLSLLGSSPHTRGARRPDPRRDSGMRIIPAYAGSTRATLYEVSVVPDHPRIRGEHERLRPRILGLLGSSPHTRGARRRRPHPNVDRRIIPAYAGSTRTYAAGEPLARDHPRIRGEHEKTRHPPPQTPGSSPHTRGARRQCGLYDEIPRIIPAYAGSTSRNGAVASIAADHPRIRGEHAPLMATCRSSPGSSPHTRGAQILAAVRRWPSGIIPAYAGSTATGPTRARTARDHPRIRGEHSRRLIHAR